MIKFCGTSHNFTKADKLNTASAIYVYHIIRQLLLGFPRFIYFILQFVRRLAFAGNTLEVLWRRGALLQIKELLS